MKSTGSKQKTCHFLLQLLLQDYILMSFLRCSLLACFLISSPCLFPSFPPNSAISIIFHTITIALLLIPCIFSPLLDLSTALLKSVLVHSLSIASLPIFLLPTPFCPLNFFEPFFAFNLLSPINAPNASLCPSPYLSLVLQKCLKDALVAAFESQNGHLYITHSLAQRPGKWLATIQYWCNSTV